MKDRGGDVKEERAGKGECLETAARGKDSGVCRNAGARVVGDHRATGEGDVEGPALDFYKHRTATC